MIRSSRGSEDENYRKNNIKRHLKSELKIKNDPLVLSTSISKKPKTSKKLDLLFQSQIPGYFDKNLDHACQVPILSSFDIVCFSGGFHLRER